MNYTMTFPESLYQEMRSFLLRDENVEQAGFAFARTSTTGTETRLLLREFRAVDPCDVFHSDCISMKINSCALAKASKYADDSKQCLVFVHSHPAGCAEFSPADDVQEPPLFRTAYTRIGGEGPHASLVLPHNGDPIARVWLANAQVVDVSRIRVIGKRFLFFDRTREYESPEFFNRQVRAFGENTQALLASLHIAVVGAGGTGSATIEQLIRLGVGKLSIYDGQYLEKSNVSRVYGSRVRDEGRAKVEILAAWAAEIGLGTEVILHPEHITVESAAKSLRDADIVFGCTDDDWGRAILNDLSFRYLIPVIDMAVKIPSRDGIIHSVCGRVTVLIPGAACLFCRERITPARIKAQSDAARDPVEAEALKREGYAPELEETDPSVIPFTAAMASFATTELIHRLTGFMGSERRSTEIIHFFDRNETRTNAVRPKPGCKCGQSDKIGIGDTRDFLGMLWE